jgi:hypothetical protein
MSAAQLKLAVSRKRTSCQRHAFDHHGWEPVTPVRSLEGPELHPDQTSERLVEGSNQGPATTFTEQFCWSIGEVRTGDRIGNCDFRVASLTFTAIDPDPP